MDGTLVHSRRFVNSTTSQTDTGTESSAGSVTESSGSPTAAATTSQTGSGTESSVGSVTESSGSPTAAATTSQTDTETESFAVLVTESSGSPTAAATTNQADIGTESYTGSVTESSGSLTAAVTTSQTDTGTESSAGSVTESSSSPTVVSAPSKVSSLSISSSVLVAPMVQAASPAASVANPIVSLPTSTYTGQALLTAACAIPLYTAVPLSDGSYLAAPVVGCAEANPQCCPSVSQGLDASAVPTASIIPFSEANPAIVSALNADPLILCPADYTSTASSCCPV
jgi:hypothetical protein